MLKMIDSAGEHWPARVQGPGVQGKDEKGHEEDHEGERSARGTADGPVQTR